LPVRAIAPPDTPTTATAAMTAAWWLWRVDVAGATWASAQLGAGTGTRCGGGGGRCGGWVRCGSVRCGGVGRSGVSSGMSSSRMRGTACMVIVGALAAEASPSRLEPVASGTRARPTRRRSAGTRSCQCRSQSAAVAGVPARRLRQSESGWPSQPRVIAANSAQRGIDHRARTTRGPSPAAPSSAGSGPRRVAG